MLQTFKQSFSLKCTLRTNMLINAIRSIPLIGKLLPSNLYAAEGFKVMAFILVLLWEIVFTFLTKLIYVGGAIMLPLSLYADLTELPKAEIFLHMLLFLTVVGGFIHSKLFETNYSANVAINMLRTDAKKYLLSNFGYFLLRTAVGFLPFLVIFGLLAKVPVWLSLLLPFSIVGCKLCVSALSLWWCRRFGYVFDENKANKLNYPVVILGCLAAFLLPVFRLTLPPAFSILLLLAMIPLGVCSIKPILAYTGYKDDFSRILRTNEEQLDRTLNRQKNLTRAQISGDAAVTSRREGFEYFNEIFVKRHRKLLWNATEIITGVLLVVLALLVVIILRFPSSRGTINRLMMPMLHVLPFVLYAINRGMGFTQALFMNCDHSMLTYPFFKKPRSILALFRIRLREIMKINAVPAAVIGVGSALLMLLTGGTDAPVNYLVLIISPLAISMFFSVHYLTIYYLLQPYTAESEIKSPLYKVISGATYFVCYMTMQVNPPPLLFGLLTIVFCVIYCVIACLLVYKFAPKTFKIHS